jgi:hypothetical protein
MATVDRNDERLQQYDNTKNNLINEAQANYNKVSSGAEQKYNELIQASKDYGQQQAEITQAKTDQTIKEINQNKDFAEKDYIKEQKGAYTDYARQTNAYGTNAEIQASAGLAGSGYSESSRVNMYNTYQNRYATARDTFNRAIVAYDNQIAQAQLQNNALLAEIAYQSLQTQLQLALEGFQYQNELLNNLLSQKLNISSTYDSLWQSQYNTLLGEAQFNEQMAYQRERDAVADAQWQQQYNLSVSKASSSGGGSSGSKLTNGSSKSSGSSKLSDGSSKVDELYNYYKKQEQQLAMTDNIGSIAEHTRWRDATVKEIGSIKDMSDADKTALMKKLQILQGNYGK